MKRNSLLIISALLVSTLMLSACGSNDIQNNENEQPLNAAVISSVVAEGTILPVKDAALAFVQGGTIAQILVEKGDWVEEGDALITLNNQSQVKAEIQAVELELLMAQQNLDDLLQNEGSDREQIHNQLLDAQLAFNSAQEDFEDLDEELYQDDLEDAEADVIESQQEVEDAQEELEEYLDLDEDNATRKRYKDALEEAQEDLSAEIRFKTELIEEHDRIVSAYLQSEANLAAIQAEYDKRLEGPDKDALEQINARISSLEARKNALQDQLDNMTINAPFSGKVIEITIEESEFASPGQAVIIIADTSKWKVESSDLTEMEVVRISEGQTVSIQAEAYPTKQFDGTVSRIGDFPITEFGDVLYQVEIDLEEDSQTNLKWGMSVTIFFTED